MMTCLLLRWWLAAEGVMARLGQSPNRAVWRAGDPRRYGAALAAALGRGDMRPWKAVARCARVRVCVSDALA